MKLSQVNLWVAIHSSRTNLHYDAYKNLLVVLHGTKSIKLYPPSQTPLLYARPIYTASTNHSEVNIEQPDLHLHPDFVGATPVEFHLNAEGIVIPCLFNECYLSHIAQNRCSVYTRGVVASSRY